MTSLLEGAKKLVTRGTDVGARIDGLEAALDACARPARRRPRRRGQAVVDRASSRLRLSADHTVVALAGATGSGKSSTFNALTGLELSAVGVRRPTTSWATACVWGDATGADELLDWLGIPPRHQSSATRCSTRGARTTRLDGLVLLDLPDHDSTEVSHHLEVDRLVQLADLLVWVLDPQKYADAADPRPLPRAARHAPRRDAGGAQPHRRRPAGPPQSMLADVRRLLDADGLGGVPVIATSARTRRGHRRAARGDRRPGRGQEGRSGRG